MLRFIQVQWGNSRLRIGIQIAAVIAVVAATLEVASVIPGLPKLVTSVSAAGVSAPWTPDTTASGFNAGLSNDYTNPTFGYANGEYGLDIAYPDVVGGTQIKAPEDGTAWWVSGAWCPGREILQTARGPIVAFGHVNAVGGTTSHSVSAGDVIATVEANNCYGNAHVEFMYDVSGADPSNIWNFLPPPTVNPTNGCPQYVWTVAGGNGLDPCNALGAYMHGAIPAHLAPGGPAVSWGVNRLDLFARDSNNQFEHLAGNGTSFGQPWEPHSSPSGTTFESQPVAVSWATNRIDLFGIGNDGVLYHQWWDGTSWNPVPPPPASSTTGWQSLGNPYPKWTPGGCMSGATPCAPLTGTPAVSSWGPNRLDIFTRDTAGHVWHMCWGGGGWCAWEDHGGNATSDPTVVNWGPNRLDVFVRGTDNGYWHQSWGGSAWGPGPTYQDWESHGAPAGTTFATRPSIAAWGPNQLDIFGIGLNGNLYHQSWSGTGWTPTPSPTSWDNYGHPTGANLTGPVAVASWSANRLDVFARDVNGASWHTFTGAWGTYEAHGGVFTADLAEVTWGANRLDIFGRGQNAGIWWANWNGSGWSAWTDQGGNTT